MSLYEDEKMELLMEEQFEDKKMIRLITDLVELNYLSMTENSLQLTKSGYDYFMRKCNLNDVDFQIDQMSSQDMQQTIYQLFFKGKSKINTVEKFIKNNL